MPSTLRINLASKDANSYIENSIDDVLNTSFGVVSSVVFAAAVERAISWPTTGETILYARFPKGGTSYTVKVSETSGGVGWTFTVPVGTGPFPLVLGKPAGTTFYVTPSIGTTAAILYL